jgi:hypothetical protein
MTGNGEFGPMAQGLEFLQGMMKSAGSAVPGMGPWMAPTLDPQELDKRITDLRTVQFWLEQNAKLIATTIQALEVQRMTLTTLKSMNVSMADLGEAFRAKEPPTAPAEPAQAEPAAAQPTPARRRSAGSREGSAGKAGPAAGAAAADPMAWWTTLTQQFTELATKAVRDSATAATGAGAEAAAAPASAAGGGKSGKPGKQAGAAARPAGRKAPRAAPAKR